jgi:thioredoxin-related protein
MNRRIALPLALFLALPLLAAGTASAEIRWRTFDAGLREAKATGRPMIVDVFTGWCGYCKKMDREVFPRDEVQAYLAKKFIPVRVDGEGAEAINYEGRAYTGATFSQRFRISGYPTFIFLRADGAHLVNVPGYMPPEQFLTLLRYVGEGALERGEDYEAFAHKANPGAR